MGEREGSSITTDAIMSTESVAIRTFPKKIDSDVIQLDRNSESHVLKDCCSKSELNDNVNSHENHIVSKEPHHLDRTSNINLPELEYNGVEKMEYHFVTQLTYEPSYEPEKRKSSLAESDDSNDDDPEKKRLKCLQYIGLLIAGTVLSIIVIYYGRVDTEGFIDFDELIRLRNNT